jgi:hypothetical protein
VTGATLYSSAPSARAWVCPYGRRCQGLISYSPSLSFWSNYQRSRPRMTAEVVFPYAVSSQYSTGCYARVRRAVGTHSSVPNGVRTHSSARTGDCFWSTRTSIMAPNENIPPRLEQTRHFLRTCRSSQMVWCTSLNCLAFSSVKQSRSAISAFMIVAFPKANHVGRADFNFATGVGLADGTIQTNPKMEISWSDDGGQYYHPSLLYNPGRRSRSANIAKLPELLIITRGRGMTAARYGIVGARARPNCWAMKASGNWRNEPALHRVGLSGWSVSGC